MNEKFKKLSLFNKKIAPYIRELTKKNWIPLQTISDCIKERMVKITPLSVYGHIIVSGETDNISIYLIGNKDLIVFTPLMNVENNLILLETLPKLIIKYSENLCIVEKNSKILDRLTFPRVLLINPSVKDVFPAPRLALCISSLACYLRKYQRADVRIIDMQIGPAINTIMREVRRFKPDIIGISISFGQLNLAESILRRLFLNIKVIKKNPIVIAGNVIAAFGYERLLNKFPELLICNGEGERTIMSLVDYSEGRVSLKEVPGITYIENGKIRKTQTIEINMDDVPLPAMDSLEGIIKNKGAITMEISRGCFHSACSFCPRTNKPRKWKGMSSDVVLRQFEFYKQIFDNFGIERRIFMADEEFIGWIDNGKETERVIGIAKRMIKRAYKIHFETNTRIDQIYNTQKDKTWHIERMKMLELCKSAGLERLLVGVESGSDNVLERFNKKIKVDDSVMAIRILTSLGIGLRVTFITFDPRMTFRELKENISFLERRDVYLKEIDLTKFKYSELLERIHDRKFVEDKSLKISFYENVAYMLVNLEVLMNSYYFRMLNREEAIYNKDFFINKEPNYNMARYSVKYEDEIIGDIASNCQKWIDRHFALDYCLKGLYKIANIQERDRLFRFRANYRKISFLLLKTLAWLFDRENSIDLKCDFFELKDMMDNLEALKYKNENQKKIIIYVLDLFNEKMSLLVANIEESINNGEITSGREELSQIIHQWREKSDWRLINP